MVSAWGVRLKQRMAYAELHCKTNFSFLEGASHPEELVERAVELGYAALAITDRNSLAGVVRAHRAASCSGLQLILGAEITPEDAPTIILLAQDRASYGRLARLITRGRRRARKGDCRIHLADIDALAEGLWAAISPGDPVPDPAGDLLCHLGRYREIFGTRCSLLAELHLGRDDRGKLARLEQMARAAQIPLLAAGDVSYHDPQRRALHEVLTATRQGTSVDRIREHLPANAQRHLRPVAEITALFSTTPQAIARSREIATACHFTLDQLRYEYPQELVPRNSTPIRYLTALTLRGAQGRYPDGIPEEAQRRIRHELTLIEQLGYEAYFLTVWDLVRFARRRDILCQGRGSAANSVVCYCLGITAIDPARMDLLFERFVSRERNEAPDIDVDFEHERREEVLQYIYQKYGRERVGMTAEVITYRSRSAIRDVGRALGLPPQQVDRLAATIERPKPSERKSLKARCAETGFDTESPLGRQLLSLVDQLCGFPRHLSQHVGGMVMTRGPLCELVPIENAAMPGRTVIEWNKDDLDQLGILKVDCLSLGMLTAIRKCFQLIQQDCGRRLTLANIPAQDAEVYDMICRADTVGVFQIESRAQMSMLPRLRPRCFYDLVIEVAIVRPGPIQGDMVHPYLQRRHGLVPVEYPSMEVRNVLKKTLGVPLFQEQAMRLAMVAAGFTPGEADALRRAMGAWRSDGSIDPFRRRLLDGMRQRGYSDAYSERLFRQLRSFGLYGFPESHAASFALLVYVSAWLKHHYPAAFTAALLNSQPMGFYAPAQLVRSARSHRVTVRPADVNHSVGDCTLENDADEHDTDGSSAVRLGLRTLSGISARVAERIVAARTESGEPRPYRSLEDFTARTRLGRATVMQLSQADAFLSLEMDRRTALWNALAQESSPREYPLFTESQQEDDPCSGLPPLSEWEQVLADYQTQGLSLRRHPISFYRSLLDARDAVCCDRLRVHPNGQRTRVAGLVLNRQRPGTARGITFITLEDETGTANLILHPGTWERFRHVASTAAALVAQGRLERKDHVMHVIVDRLEELRDALHGLGIRSRDFR